MGSVYFMDWRLLVDWTSIYGHDFSEDDDTIFYRPVVNRMEMYLFFLQMGQYFQTCWMW